MPLEHVHSKNQSVRHNECVRHLREISAFLLWIENGTPHKPTRKQVEKTVRF